MEEILVEDTGEKCLEELAAAAVLPSVVGNSSVGSNCPAAAVGAATTTACATVASGTANAEDPAATHVMSMLYIQQSNSENGNGLNQQQSQFHVVNKSQIAAFNQIVLQGLSQVGQNQIAQPITIRRQINSVNPASPAQTQKHILVRKSNASSAQIMPLGTSQESQIHTQAAPSIAYFIKPKPQETVVIPQGSISAAQLSQKLVIAPVISHVTPTANTTTRNVQNQTPKHMTNIILPMSIPQQSVSITKKRLGLEQNLNLKYNNGHINSGAITVLRESKTSNAASNPPPLHPISKMSLLNGPKSNSNSSDSIQITENPDSAVITPIPKKDDNNSEKRKKTISNILRGSGEKVRVRKQDLQSSLQDTSEMTSYTLSSPDVTQEKDKKRGKESDDDITFIEVVPSEEKKLKRPSISDEIIRKLNSQEIEIIEKCEKVNGKQSNEEIKAQTTLFQNDSNYDATKALEWKDGVGSLPGSNLKFCMNEFGLMEVVDEGDNKQDRDSNIGDKENKCLTQSSSKSCSPTTVNEKKLGDKKARSVSADTFYCCEGCGCHGLASEFHTPNSCSPSCSEYIEDLRQQKLRKEKELNKEMKVKKRRKKLLQEQEREKNKDLSSKANDDDKSKDSEDTFDKLEEKSKPDTDEDTKDTNISLMDDETQGDSESKYPWQTGKLGFSWSKYLEHTKTKAAPVKLFKDPFPYTKNNFKVSMKLEGIDPNNPSHYCVLTVAEVVGYRLRLHFDGYAENFDFWVNADSMDIFPVGWAEKNGHKLQPPKGYTQDNFNWNAYLKICKATSVPKTIFSNRNSMLPTGFRVGMKLEAVDRKHSSLVCVASVADVMDSRILVHFDSWDDVYDYWADVSSPYIHPIGWCHHNGRSLTPPNFFKDAKSFSWDAYLKSTGSIAAPSRAFKQRPPCAFKRCMKLEAVDKRLPQLIRVTTVEDVKDHMIKIRFDGWPENHGYWVDDDSPDIHPMGWCSKTGHPLEPPLTQDNLSERPECGTFGCRGIGHVKGPKFATHNSASGCPYSPQNINKIKTITDRLNLKHEVNDFDEEVTVEKPKLEKLEKNKTDRFEKRLLSFEEKPIKTETIKQEDGDSSDKNEKIDTSERLSGKWRINSDGQTDEEEIYRKRKKRKFGQDESNSLSSFTSNHNTSSTSTPYAPTMPDKQLRMELYHSVYNPGYNPMPDAPHVWAKHSNALNRVVSKQNTNPRRWSSEEVIKFIQSLPNCREIGSVFRKHNLDGDGFLMLTQEDLVSTMGLRLGPAIKLYNSIVLLRKRVT
ncbi:lethal(3)malignant brain tumor-like protein 3 [Phymastichus coffea]|uniref:lethal(3)malignant brain tumor-like protein 3 n=1 Tax=Phymastichus coffea TaxID=108790 RepID=UPI00273A8B12|nr:lethal(3)malignant brain tumor-like protein 3 [Phymastichus coffea]XP_058797157.1 lethal(3)malignant brain tumor-like protein 3 [Phymastichus coffea]XP_058797158.1 lethal(3)malignant brain tumor-like protein 3 [Phymastichus coffea]XP_058797159.1 lethal(3)malignant brain tumor-like protein 3 [Phymastichus coffea]XP_058797160.1 lethal(3)malignant brain tumor-like protein 3 [Phymastichus coffea]